jgi:beta-glucosidase
MGDVKLSASKIKKNEKLIAEVEVTNSGAMDGKETALWFIFRSGGLYFAPHAKN